MTIAWAPPVSRGAALCELLSHDERARLARLRRTDDRARFLTGRALARTMLGARLGLAPAAVPLAPDAGGRPVVTGSGVSLSITHAARRVVVAIADGVAVGVDVEPLAREPLRELWPSLCTPAEHATLVARTDTASHEAAVVLWTRKEAVLKACGVGLGVPMTSLEIGGTAEHPRVIATAPPLPPAGRLQIAGLALGPGYGATIAILRDDEQ